ncbi:uncharacterized protein LOC108161167 isoform X2 [Drosophila miranda]|uniref:uncharacterized protein LOC108161167 isoform X2 n=1 Tax=Drosophila miranda TaxID=7229 RepID=UPI00143F26CA|nr:uncharacterized protein LOC108161167 isoform X2 [Drosophila miranda]
MVTRLGVAGSEQSASEREVPGLLSSYRYNLWKLWRSDRYCIHDRVHRANSRYIFYFYDVRRMTYDICRCKHYRHRLRSCTMLYFIGFDRVAPFGGQEYLLRAACPLPLFIRDLTFGFGHCQSSLLRLSIPLAGGTSSGMCVWLEFGSHGLCCGP